MANWSELPNDVLEYLTNFLPLPDYHRFGAVCQTWCSIAKQKLHRPPHLPWLVLGHDNATQKRTFFNLSENKNYDIEIPELQGQYICGCSYGWLFTIDTELNCHLLNPLTRKQYDLPTVPPYNEYYKTNPFLTEPMENCTKSVELRMLLVFKAVLDYDPSDRPDFKVVIVYGQSSKLAFWRSGDPKWSYIQGYYSNMEDVLFSNGKLYAFTSLQDQGLCVVDDWSDPKITQLSISIPLECDDNVACCPYLVDVKGELLLVQRYRSYNKEKKLRTTVDIQVHKIDIGREVSSICKHTKGCTIFLGKSSPVVVDPSISHSDRKNAIYFTDVCCALSASKHERVDLGIYDMNTRMFSRYDPPHIDTPDAVPIWFNPNPW
ncbi:F-box family protein [Rhynchospora pubera]|uniref:F-box family protein n=1 Tax=Rhynchospora pubera TaxID=906938 RepID=A0AAV8GUI7_9POAL|nr:F-box family protein [Rhynchospora pubera]